MHETVAGEEPHTIDAGEVVKVRGAGASILPIGNTNYPSLNDPVINSALAQFEKLTDPAAKAALATQIDTAVMNNAVYLPYQNDAAVFYRNPRTTNIYLQAGLGSYYDVVNVGVSK